MSCLYLLLLEGVQLILGFYWLRWGHRWETGRPPSDLSLLAVIRLNSCLLNCSVVMVSFTFQICDVSFIWPTAVSFFCATYFLRCYTQDQVLFLRPFKTTFWRSWSWITCSWSWCWMVVLVISETSLSRESIALVMTTKINETKH